MNHLDSTFPIMEIMIEVHGSLTFHSLRSSWESYHQEGLTFASTQSLLHVYTQYHAEYMRIGKGTEKEVQIYFKCINFSSDSKCFHFEVSQFTPKNGRCLKL